MSVSVCLITRNHESCVERAIRSVAGLHPEVIVGDTGSTDQTVALATNAGARVCPLAWADDFSAASNSTLDQAGGDWILLLNPDEELEPEGAERLNLAMADPKIFAVRLRVRDQITPDRSSLGTMSWEVRLFRRDPAVRYRGRLHPFLATPPEQLAAARGQSVVAVDATIRRHAYLSPVTPEKLRWVARLLEAELKDRPGQLHYLIELGRNLLWQNQPRGHEVLAEAAEHVRAAAGNPAPPAPNVGSLLEYLLTVSPAQSRSTITRSEARQLAARWFPTTPPVLWAVASERFEAADYSSAAMLLERLVEMGRTGIYDSTGGRFSAEIIGRAAIANLSMCYLHQGRWDEAKIGFAGLLNDPEYAPAATRGYVLAERHELPSGTLPPASPAGATG